MAILRTFNVLGQMRWDVPHTRLLESAARGDADALIGRLMGGSQGLVVRGFNVLTTGAIGAPATQLQVAVADAIAINVGATESGSMLWVSPTRAPETLANNARVSGSFTPAATNFIGIDFSRAPDATTDDVVAFFSAASEIEITEEVPLGITLDYRFVVTTTPFALQPNVAPLAIVTTDASNFVLTLVDARNLDYRLGTGGDNPQPQSTYAWPGGRLENTTGDVFSGGDKAIASQRDWQRAVMTRVWELGGGEAWYRPTNTLNVKVIKRPGLVFSNGDAYEVVASNLHWQGLALLFPNAETPGLYYNVVADQTTSSPGLTDLQPGECIYVDLNYGSNGAVLTAVKTTLQTLSQSVQPGNRVVLAWCSVDTGGFYTRDSGYPVGTTFAPATTTSLGIVELTVAAANPAIPLVIPVDANNTLNVGLGAGAILGNNPAIKAQGHGSGPGMVTTGGASGGDGIDATGGGGGYGGAFTGGTSNGGGILGQGVGGGDGVLGENAMGGSGAGVHGISQSAGPAVRADASIGTGAAIVATAAGANPALEITAGKISTTYLDTTMTPGSAIANTISGRSCFATGTNQCTITNSLVTATSVVLVELDASGASTWGGVIQVQCVGGSFVVSSVTANGSLTNVTVAVLNFRWIVFN